MVDLYGKCIGKYTSPMDPIKYTRSGQTLFKETVSKKIKPNSRMAAQKQFGFVNRYSLEFTQKDGVAWKRRDGDVSKK